MGIVALQETLQLLTSPVHTHLERGHRDLELLRHLLVRPTFNVLEHERLSLIDRKTLERSVNAPPDLVLFGHGKRAGLIDSQLPNLVQRLFASTSTLHLILAQVRRDPEQPTTDAIRVSAAREATVAAHEGQLHDVFGLVGPSRHALSVPKEHVLITTHEEGVLILMAV